MHISGPLAIQGRRASDDLDLVRGLAAVAVLAFHIRNRFFLDYDLLPAAAWHTKLFYAATAFGHDAVIVFFVLSGYFISSSVMRDRARGRWSWSHYAVNRVTRLFVVLLPGLLLTLCWDGLRLWLFPHGPVFIGDHQEAWLSSVLPLPRNLALEVIGNALFLQTILVFPLGSNGALWSLSYEFWYYVLFPLVFLAWRGERARPIATVAAVAAILLFVGAKIALYFPIWLLGTAVYAAPAFDSWKREHSRLIAAGGLMLFTLLVAFTHTGRFKQWSGGSEILADYITALMFALVLYVLIHNQSPSKIGRYSQLSGLLAGFSYTLYVTHLPLLVFIRGALPADPRLPGALNYGVVLALLGVCLGYAYLISRVSEAQTDRVRKAVTRRVDSRAGAPVLPG